MAISKNAVYRQKEKRAEKEDLCKEILENSRNELYLNLRFFDAALSGLIYVPDNALHPAGTDGQALFFSPDSLITLFKSDRRLVNRTYMHILMHCLFLHIFQKPESVTDDPQEAQAEGANPRPEVIRWNLACDITAEYLLDELYLPCLHKRKSSLRLQTYQELKKILKVITAQGVYHHLEEVLLQNPDLSLTALQGEFTVDDHRLWEDSCSRPRKEQLRRKWEDLRSKMQTVMETFSSEASSDSKELYDHLAVENRRRYDYRAFLRKFAVLREEMLVDPDSFDYVFYNYGFQTYGNMPLIEPLETKEVYRIEDFVIVIDTSMSCSGELVKRFLEETFTILTEKETYARKIQIRLLQCDEQVRDDALITSRTDLKTYMENFTVIGQGGTDFRPAFAYVNALQAKGAFHRLRGLIYFTDGYGIYPVRKPLYDTAFVFLKENYQDVDVPPWAIRIVLEPEEWNSRRQIPRQKIPLAVNSDHRYKN